MIIRIQFVILLILVSISGSTQEINQDGKKIWAKSFLNKKAPTLVVDKWITDRPDTKGKFVIIDFWATWCSPCKRAIPELNKFAKLFKEDLIVIGISDQSPEKIKAMNNPVITYYLASDPQRRMMRDLQIRGIPHVIVIDPKGIVRWEGLPILPNYELTAVCLKTSESYNYFQI